MAVVEVKRFACNEVQNPPKGNFNSDALTWFPSTRKGPNVENRVEAWIHSARLSDFLEGWYERMMDDYEKKGKKSGLVSALAVADEASSRLERAVKPTWIPFDAQFDSAALQHSLGAGPPQKRKKRQLSRSQIGSSRSLSQPSRITSL
ncbi:hypothetical protein R1sor_012498 [Riccia sorocarpa]|uniref:Transposase n=1 Tax=Riccia sorocarpa TaxID=122646 RepID=A0ABD3I6M2_9MARC